LLVAAIQTAFVVVYASSAGLVWSWPPSFSMTLSQAIFLSLSCLARPLALLPLVSLIKKLKKSIERRKGRKLKGNNQPTTGVVINGD